MYTVEVLYKNYKGEVAWRHLIPHNLHFGKSEWHKESQWLMKAFDVDKNAVRDFAMKDILHWGSESTLKQAFDEARKIGQSSAFAVGYGKDETI